MSPEQRIAEQLRDLSTNLWWSWNPATIKLFRDIDPERFRASKDNAYMITKTLTPERLRELANDALFRARVDRAHRELRAYMSPQAITWAPDEARLQDDGLALQHRSDGHGLRARVLPAVGGRDELCHATAVGLRQAFRRIPRPIGWVPDASDGGR